MLKLTKLMSLKKDELSLQEQMVTLVKRLLLLFAELGADLILVDLPGSNYTIY